MKYVILLLIGATALFASSAFAFVPPPPPPMAPEPVSSTLFLVGAAALGYRQYKKRKRDK